MNNQSIEKSITSTRGLVEVYSIFQTIQGEGPFVGEPSVFIRLAGCNLQCPLCDTEYTNHRTQMYPKAIVDVVDAQSTPNKLVVITGGEPLRQTIGPMIVELLHNGYRVQIETNGTLYQPSDLEEDYGIPYRAVTVICSPKAGTLNRKLVPHIDALKYVIHKDQIKSDDGLPTRALAHTAKPHVARPPIGFTGKVYVQPVDVKDDAENLLHLNAAINSCLTHGYTLGIQLHKYLNVE